LKPLNPFNLKPILDDIKDFLSTTRSNSRILFSFDDPGDSYYSIFDDQRKLLEALIYKAVQKESNIIPNWYLVGEDMDGRLPSFWGRDFNKVVKNISTWKPDYLIYYTRDGSTSIDPKFEACGMQRIATFDWRKYPKLADTSSGIPFLPKWILFRVPPQLHQT